MSELANSPAIRPVVCFLRHTPAAVVALLMSAMLLVGSVKPGEARETRILVGFSAGGSVDIIARVMAEQLRAIAGETVVVDNKTGANQRVAITELIRSAPDGRTLLVATSSAFTVTPTIFGDKTGYDPLKDLTPITRIAKFENALAIGPKVNGSTWADYLAWAKANPKDLTYGSPGAGSIAHFFGFLLAEKTGLALSHIPYRGGAPAISDVLGGHLPLVIVGLQDVLEHHQSGKLKIIAMTGTNRSPSLPQIPTLKELGYDVVCEVGIDVYGPAGMAPELVSALNKRIGEAIKSPDFQARLEKFFMLPAFSTPLELATITAAERQMWEGPIKASGYKGD